jgi:colicin import membrane protein
MDNTQLAPPGVWWSASARKWRAQLRISGVVKTLGYFATAGGAAAAVAAARAARQLDAAGALDAPPPPPTGGVILLKGRWRVRGARGCGAEGGFASRAEAEGAAAAAAAAAAARRSAAGPRGAAAAARRAAHITGYVAWRAAEIERLLRDGAPPPAGGGGLRAELKRLWAARAGPADAAAAAEARGARCPPRLQEFNAWARQERPRLLALPEFAQVAGALRGAAVQRELAQMWRAALGAQAAAAAAEAAAATAARAAEGAGCGGAAMI